VVAALVDDGPAGRWAEALVAGQPLAAPHLRPVEAANILRRTALAVTSPTTSPASPTPTWWPCPSSSPPTNHSSPGYGNSEERSRHTTPGTSPSPSRSPPPSPRSTAVSPGPPAPAAASSARRSHTGCRRHPPIVGRD